MSITEEALILRKQLQDNNINSALFLKLLSLENAFTSGEITHHLISTLTEIYAQCIEHYDKLQDPVCLYFHEKLQNLLSSKRTIEILYEKKNEREIIKDSLGDLKVRVLSETMEDDESSYRSPEVKQDPTGASVELLEVKDWGRPKPNSAKQLERLQKSQEKTPPNADTIYLKMRKERATKMAIYMEIQENKDASLGVTRLIEDYAKEAECSDKIIQNALACQEENIKKRMHQRQASNRQQQIARSSSMKMNMDEFFGMKQQHKQQQDYEQFIQEHLKGKQL